MRIFISYRRDDTAGRAGRLFDVLVTRFGPRNVFQDVAMMSLGTDFTQQIADAIATSDAVLVVIGPDWLAISDSDGVRRLDRPGDHVRGEIAAALAATVPVVPVLVGGASMPVVGDLPPELQPLLHRQAAQVRDESWHQDVDALVRRLEGAPVLESNRRRTMTAPRMVAALVLLAALAVIGWIWADRDSDDSNSSSPDPAPCDQPDASWQPIALFSNPTREGTDNYSRQFQATVTDASVRDRGRAQRIVLSLRLDYVTTLRAEDSVFNIGASDIETLYADNEPMGPPSCFSATPRSITAGESSEMTIGFDGPYEPGSSLVLRTNVADIDVTVAGS